jgi:hypothetical protein
MPTADERLIRVRAKIERAKDHTRDIEGALHAFRNTDPYGFRTEDDPQTGDKIYRIHIRSDTPLGFSLIVGDAIHNLRSALDHLAWQLVEVNGKTPSKGTYFPISETLTKYKSSKGAKIQGMSAGAKNLLDSIKPYQGGNDDLWILNELDNFDKHRLLFVTAFGLNEVMPTFKLDPRLKPELSSVRAVVKSLESGSPIMIMRHGSLSQEYVVNGPLGIQRDGTIPILQDGAEVARLKAPINEDSYFDLSFEIAFRQPPIVQSKPVLPLLHQMTHLVNGIVSQFVPFL